MPDTAALKSAVDAAYRAQEQAELELYDRLELMLELRRTLSAACGGGLHPDAKSSLGPQTGKIADANQKLGTLTADWLRARRKVERVRHSCRVARSALRKAGED